jgi:hypothetical protein
MEQKEYEAYIEHQIASLNSQYKMAIVQNKNWQDLLLESIKDDKDFDEVYKTFLSKLEKSNSINLSNPDKLARDYALMSGDSITIQYMGQDSKSYNYTYKVRTKPNIAGELFIVKDKLDGKVCIQFKHKNGGSESRVYEMDEFTDFQTFMGLIVDVINKFR